MLGVKLRIHPLFLLAGLLSVFTGDLMLFLAATVAAVLHECAHAFVARRYGFALDKLVLMPYGAVIAGDIAGIGKKQELAVLAAGPLANACTALFFAALWWLWPETYAYTDTAAYVSLSLFLVNLLPAYPLDGGRLLFLLLRPLGEARARLLSRISAFLTAAGILAVFAVSCFSRPNFSALFFALLLLAGNFGGGSYRRIAFPRGRSFSRGVEEKRIVLSSERTAGECVRYLREDRYLVLIVYEDGEYLGELSEGELFAVLEAGGYRTTLKEALERPLEEPLEGARPSRGGETGGNVFQMGVKK